MTRDELKQDIKAYNKKRGHNPHVDFFIEEFKNRAEKDGITLLKMNLPSSLVLLHPKFGILNKESQVDDVSDIDDIVSKAYVAKTRKLYGSPKETNENEKYECMEDGYYFSMEQLYDMLLLDRVKGYDIFGIYDFGIVTTTANGTKIDDPWVMGRYGKVMSSLRFSNLKDKIIEKWT